MQNKTIKVIFFGDVVGKPGRNILAKYLSTNTSKKYDFIIANIENASHGFGLTEKNYKEFVNNGIDCMTCGNHIWDKKELFNYIDNAENLVRPINYPTGTKGVGYKIFEKNGIKIGVINVLGRVFLGVVEPYWELVTKTIEEIKKITPIIIIDFHAEATAEKICFGKYCSELGVSAFFGTHTHVQTADNEVLNNKTAYITDAGFCGASDGVIGMDYQTSLNRFLTSMPERYEVAKGDSVQINAVEVEIDIETGKALSIERIFSREYNINEGNRGEKEN